MLPHAAVPLGPEVDLLAEAIEAAKTGAVNFETLLRSVSQTCLDEVKMDIPKHLPAK